MNLNYVNSYINKEIVVDISKEEKVDLARASLKVTVSAREKLSEITTGVDAIEFESILDNLEAYLKSQIAMLSYDPR